MFITYLIGRDGVVNKPSDSLVMLTLADGSDGGNFDNLNELLDKKPPEECTVYFQGQHYPLVAVQSGVYDLVFEIVIDTKDCRELRLGTNTPVRKDRQYDGVSLGITWVVEGWYGRRLRTGAVIKWRFEEGWYNRPDQP